MLGERDFSRARHRSAVSFPAPDETRLSTRSQSPSRFLADRQTILAETIDEITGPHETWTSEQRNLEVRYAEPRCRRRSSLTLRVET